MKETKAEIILDSIISGRRVTCMRVTYPRIVHAEFMRHRIGSYCSASSRAIPMDRIIKQYYGFIPDKFRKHQPGMQPDESYEFTQEEIDFFVELYREGLKYNEDLAIKLHKDGRGLAKEQVNRWLEPGAYITHLVQMTDIGFTSFLKLRLPTTAQYEIRQIAVEMEKEYLNSVPVVRDIHLPFFEDADISKEIMSASSARCARTSYFNHEGKTPTLKEDLELAGNLQRDKHWSPFEFPIMTLEFAMDFFKGRVNFMEPCENERYFIYEPLYLLSNKTNLNDTFEFSTRIKELHRYRDLSGNLGDWKIVQFRKIMENIKR